MNPKHFITYFVSPALFYMAIVLFFLSAMSIIGSLGRDPGFLIIGLITFVLGYNSWMFANKARKDP
ncbi:MAG: hypothetical protein H6867_10435 [Rhodospirillales bacterium]|nr:hypothetical protein [Rhodospirillales bacterium]MCB9995799.1 hypothetical protein [Rhodospirillales bacterium]